MRKRERRQGQEKDKNRDTWREKQNNRKSQRFLATDGEWERKLESWQIDAQSFHSFPKRSCSSLSHWGRALQQNLLGLALNYKCIYSCTWWKNNKTALAWLSILERNYCWTVMKSTKTGLLTRKYNTRAKERERAVEWGGERGWGNLISNSPACTIVLITKKFWSNMEEKQFFIKARNMQFIHLLNYKILENFALKFCAAFNLLFTKAAWLWQHCSKLSFLKIWSHFKDLMLFLFSSPLPNPPHPRPHISV